MSSDSSNLARLLSGFDNDPKEIELVENIIEKTKAGKIVWQKQPSALVATVSSMQMNFVRSSSAGAILGRTLGGGGGAWEMFSIRRVDGTEILKVEQPSMSFLSVLIPPPPGSPPPTPPPRSKLLQSVDRLYSIADVRGQGDIDNAINVIKNL
jgi:hypothetical protein